MVNRNKVLRKPSSDFQAQSTKAWPLGSHDCDQGLLPQTKLHTRRSLLFEFKMRYLAIGKFLYFNAAYN